MDNTDADGTEPASPAMLGFIGGTGPEGQGLALRFAALGHKVIVGSRSAERAQQTVADLSALVPEATMRAAENLDAARGADIVFLTVPYSAVPATLPPLAEALRYKIVVSTIAPIEFRQGRPAAIPVPAGSAAQEVQDLMPEARVVSAFHLVDAHQLRQLNAQLDTDVIVASDDQEARRAIVALAKELPGIRAFSAGRLSASAFIESTTGLLIAVNRIYKVHSGVRITGLA